MSTVAYPFGRQCEKPDCRISKIQSSRFLFCLIIRFQGRMRNTLLFMRKFLFLFIGFISILITACKHEKSEIIENNDPFVFNMSNYFDFLKQGRALIENDSSTIGYANVTEWIVDSLMLNDSTKTMLKFRYEHTLENLNNQYGTYDVRYQIGDSVLISSDRNNLKHRFYPTLEVIKQMKYKTTTNPLNETLLEYRDNKDLLFETYYNRESKQWEYFITITDISKDSTKYEIPLNSQQVDTLIYKLNKIRDYLEVCKSNLY